MTFNRSVFDASSTNILDLFNIEGGRAGFKIPEFQRPYDWEPQNILRVFEDIINGISLLREQNESLTFLGPLITLREGRSPKESFDGATVSIIDGQQRITTFSLMCSILYERCERYKRFYEENIEDDSLRIWLKEEFIYLKSCLRDCIFGILPSDGSDFPFARIIRHEDFRAKDLQDSQYNSIIGNFIFDFAYNIHQNKVVEIPNLKRSTTEQNKNLDSFKRNLNYISNLIDELKYEKSENSKGNEFEFKSQLLSLQDFKLESVKPFFEKIPAQQDKNGEDQAKADLLSRISEEDKEIIDGLVLLTFSKYLLKNVMTTLVDAYHEKYAFEIFDSLNTAGEPLTAIQTFKPQVYKFEQETRTEGEKDCRTIFKETIDSYFNKHFQNSESRQKESKEVVRSFALYVNGEKINESLNFQRSFLKNRFEQLKDESRKRKFVEHLSNLISYKENCWFKSNIDLIPDSEGWFKLCLRFITDTNKTLTIPILARFYNENGFNSTFKLALKALTAFIVLRRGYTGGTSGIDDDFRAVMFGSKNYRPLSAGLEHDNQILSLDEFRSRLRYLLAYKMNIKTDQLDEEGKNKWVKTFSNLNISSLSKNITKFSLLAAYNSSVYDPNAPHLLRKDRTDKSNYLDYRVYCSKAYSTIEHVAPQNIKSGKWDTSLIENPELVDRIGNLTLLPSEENSGLSDKSWEDKRQLYEIFSREAGKDARNKIQEAKDKNISITNKNEQLIKERGQLSIVKNISKVEEWDSDIVNERSENLSENIWEEVFPWLRN